MSIFTQFARALGYGPILDAAEALESAIGIKTTTNEKPTPSVAGAIAAGSSLAQAAVTAATQTTAAPQVPVNEAINMITQETSTYLTSKLGTAGTIGGDLLLLMAPELEAVVDKYLPSAANAAPASPAT